MMQQELVTREMTSHGPVRSRKVGARGAATKKRSVTINIAESPLTWLHAHGHLEDRLYEAGERLRADWERAQLGPGVTMSCKRCFGPTLRGAVIAADAVLHGSRQPCERTGHPHWSGS